MLRDRNTVCVSWPSAARAGDRHFADSTLLDDCCLLLDAPGQA